MIGSVWKIMLDGARRWNKYHTFKLPLGMDTEMSSTLFRLYMFYTYICVPWQGKFKVNLLSFPPGRRRRRPR